jgi:hypothetical protein
MRWLTRLLLPLCLMIGLVLCNTVHAMDFSEMAESAASLQAASEPLPADADHAYPHHHSTCHAHNVAAPVKACGRTGPLERAAALRPDADLALAAGPPGSMLRPPIA